MTVSASSQAIDANPLSDWSPSLTEIQPQVDVEMISSGEGAPSDAGTQTGVDTAATPPAELSSDVAVASSAATTGVNATPPAVPDLAGLTESSHINGMVGTAQAPPDILSPDAVAAGIGARAKACESEQVAVPDTSAVLDVDGEDPSTPTSKGTAPDVFPCIEQPVRVTLHCRNGYYLWGLRNGRVIGRGKRSERDEFRLNYIDSQAGIVEIINHKFGGILQVVVEEGGAAKVVCVKDKSKEEEGETTASQSQPPAASTETIDPISTSASEEELDLFEDEPAATTNASTTQKEDRQWYFVRAADGEGVLLKSLRTGNNLATDDKGKVVLVADGNESVSLWDMECVTGELCFLSNPRLSRRIRCNMVGLLSLTDAWKGWEVFRIMETGNHHYVKISSWMHQQWLLCSTATGDVTACSHARSLASVEDNNGRCSQWAIEKSPHGEGVIIRSRAHGRLLSVKEGVLKTFDPENPQNNEDTTEALLQVAGQQTTTNKKRWNNSMSNMNQSMRSLNQSVRTMQKRLSQTSPPNEEKEVVVPQEETLVWQFEAAHQQTYYFLNTVDNAARSIGPFPYATSNLRQTDKIQLKRTAQSTKLYLAEKEQYISCSPEGNITLVQMCPEDDHNTEWIMEKPSDQEGGSVFRSKHHNLYLSYHKSSDGVEEKANTEASSTEQTGGHFKNPFGGKSEAVAKLVGSEAVGQRELWKLEPCMPRAVSSEKIKTFALGTSIAVGTTIAMPFALAGASAVLGAVGAEAGVLFNVIAAGLTGAEALASVGAIGATAYIVFRPEENSLTDDHKKDDEEEGERAWSKRPFSNWRNW